MEIEKIKTSEGKVLEGALILKPSIHIDSRGYFIESWNEKVFNDSVEQVVNFVLDTHSYSVSGVIRGLHYQLKPSDQGKLIRCTRGRIFDVLVDIRKNSSTFLQWAGVNLNCKDHNQVWIPYGFAHGFLTLSKESELLYKNTAFWSKENQRTISWKDKKIGITWPKLKDKYILSENDSKALEIDQILDKDLI